METKFPHHGQNRRIVVGIIAAPFALAATLFAIFAVLIGCVAIVFALTFRGFEFGRKPLDPIPVPPEACPYLDPVRVVVADLTNWWNEHLFPRPEQLVPKLDALDVVLKNAQPHVPTRIAKEFDVILLETRVGRDELARTPNVLVPDVNERYMDAFWAGVRALENASDLIGDACGDTLYTGRVV